MHFIRVMNYNGTLKHDIQCLNVTNNDDKEINNIILMDAFN